MITKASVVDEITQIAIENDIPRMYDGIHVDAEGVCYIERVIVEGVNAKPVRRLSMTQLVNELKERPGVSCTSNTVAVNDDILAWLKNLLNNEKVHILIVPDVEIE